MNKLTDEQIKEGNKLITEFRGYTVYNKRYPRNHDIGVGEMPKDCILKKLKYHNDWNELMKVIIKIEQLGYLFENTRFCDSNKYYARFTEIDFDNCDGCRDEVNDGNYIYMYYHEGDKIECAFQSVIDFINDYNLNTK